MFQAPEKAVNEDKKGPCCSGHSHADHGHHDHHAHTVATVHDPVCGMTVNPATSKHRFEYKGETFLLIFQNLHRYTMYFALLFVVILSYDALVAFFHEGRIGIGLGSIILTVNAILLAAYCFGCHSFRHIIGGRTDARRSAVKSRTAQVFICHNG